MDSFREFVVLSYLQDFFLEDNVGDHIAWYPSIPHDRVGPVDRQCPQVLDPML
jgi:hypothetical protein